MTEDEMDFEARKYSHRFLWIGLLDSGNIAVAGADRQLLTIYAGFHPEMARLDQPFIEDLLKEAFSKSLPQYIPPPEVNEVHLKDLDELDLTINL